MPIISISLPQNLLDKLDEIIETQGYTGRSEFIREALREFIEEKYISREKLPKKLYALVIALTNHEIRPSVDEKFIQVIHEYQPIIRSFYHQLLERGYCLNIAVIEAGLLEARELLKTLRRIRGIEKIWFIPINIGDNYINTSTE